MSVQLIRKDKTSKKNWLRMIEANELLWNAYKPDAVLKAGKGWLIQSLDAIHIIEVFDKNNVQYEKKSEYLIEIL
jgi:hypothetical protein